jgi:hypothetical protein
LLGEVGPVFDGIEVCGSIVGMFPEAGGLVARAYVSSVLVLHKVELWFLVSKHTHLDKGIKHQLLLRLATAIGGRCHVIGRARHYSCKLLEVIFSVADDVRGEVWEELQLF